MFRIGAEFIDLDPSFADAVRRWLVPWCDWYGLSVSVAPDGAYRSMTEQDRLYRLGRSAGQYAARTKLRGTQGSVTDAPAGYSPHNYGLALDLDGPDAAAAVDIARQLGFGLVSWDPLHIEHPQWRQIAGV